MTPEEHGRVSQRMRLPGDGVARGPGTPPGNAAGRPGLKGQEDPVMAGGCERWDYREESWECGGTSLGPGLGTEY